MIFLICRSLCIKVPVKCKRTLDSNGWISQNVGHISPKIQKQTFVLLYFILISLHITFMTIKQFSLNKIVFNFGYNTKYCNTFLHKHQMTPVSTIIHFLHLKYIVFMIMSPSEIWRHKMLTKSNLDHPFQKSNQAQSSCRCHSSLLVLHSTQSQPAEEKTDSIQGLMYW